jgi:predicted RNA-binding protein with PUA-like domain
MYAEQREEPPMAWLIKSDPDEYSAQDLERDGRTTWDGVSNAVALKNLRGMKPGEPVLLYHTGQERAVVALARVASAPRADPRDKSGKLVVIDLSWDRWLPAEVPLARIKADKAFAAFALVRIGRLSVMPVEADHWSRILKLAAEAQK